MKFPIIVIGYGNFVETSKLFFYEIGGIGCLPIFTDPTLAILFIQSATERMGDLLVGKPHLKTLACTQKRHFLDMLQLIATLVPDIRIVELNPHPLTGKHRKDLPRECLAAKSEKYDIAELITMLQSDSNTP